MLNVSITSTVHTGLQLHKAGHKCMQLPLGALHLCLYVTELLTQLGSLSHPTGSKLIQLQHTDAQVDVKRGGCTRHCGIEWYCSMQGSANSYQLAYALCPGSHVPIQLPLAVCAMPHAAAEQKWLDINCILVNHGCCITALLPPALHCCVAMLTCAICRSLVCTTSFSADLPLNITSCVSARAFLRVLISSLCALQHSNAQVWRISAAEAPVSV